jgi:uncharacterized RDD family membrane protein YckC
VSEKSSSRLLTSAKNEAGDTPGYAGKRFGLPEEGPMSVAPMGRRVGALFVDWIVCELVVSLVTRHSMVRVTDSAFSSTQDWTMIVCFLEIYLMTAISGLTVGKRLFGIRAIRTDGGRPGFRWGLLRTVLLFCVIPPLIADRDLRGLHDRASDTVVVRT